MSKLVVVDLDKIDNKDIRQYVKFHSKPYNEEDKISRITAARLMKHLEDDISPIVDDEYKMGKIDNLLGVESTKILKGCEHCSKTYGTLGCCDTVSNEWVYSCEDGQKEYEEFRNIPKKSELLTFNDLPVNSLFMWGNGLRFFKTKDAVPDASLSKQEPDCISLSNLHDCVIAAKAPCVLIKTFSKNAIYEAVQKLHDLYIEE